MNQLKLNEQNIIYTPAVIEFKDYELTLANAKKVAEYIKSLELTDDNKKEIKKELADARKVVKAIDEIRKKVKREANASLSEFEAKIKAVTGVIEEADNYIDTKIKQVEEAEKAEKYALCMSVFETLFNQSKLVELTDVKNAVDAFWDKSYLNKTLTMVKYTKAVNDWISQKEYDLEIIEEMDFKDEILAEYAKTFDLKASHGLIIELHKIMEEQAKRKQETNVEMLDGFMKIDEPANKVKIVIDLNDLDFVKSLLDGIIEYEVEL